MEDNEVLDRSLQFKDLSNESNSMLESGITFCELPLEISLEILRLAGSKSQGTYRALLLTSRAIHQLVRVECIPFLPVVISTKSQVESFSCWLRLNPTLVTQVKHLWLVPDSSPLDNNNHGTLAILLSCPCLVSIACGIRDLQEWDEICIMGREYPSQLSTVPLTYNLRLPSSLKHITVLDNASWRHRLLVQLVGSELFSHIQTLHVIGCRSPQTEFPSSVLLQQEFTNLTEASFSFPRGALPNFESLASSRFVQSPKLDKVAFITRTRPGLKSRMISSEVQSSLGPRFTLRFRPKRWTETKMWKERITDVRSVWKLRQHELMQTHQVFTKFDWARIEALFRKYSIPSFRSFVRWRPESKLSVGGSYFKNMVFVTSDLISENRYRPSTTMNSKLPPYTPLTVNITSPLLCISCSSKLDGFTLPDNPFHQSIASRLRNGCNIPVSSGVELAQINSFLADASEVFVQYDTAISEVESILTSLKKMRSELQCRSDSAKNLVSAPIRSLPLEVLHAILSLCCEVDDDDGDSYHWKINRHCYSLMLAENRISCPTLKLSWVCSFWRTLIQSRPNLWSSFRLESSALDSRPGWFCILLEYLSRSRDDLLKFKFSLKGDPFSPGSKIIEVTNLLLDNSTRWHRCSWRYSSTDGGHWLAYLYSTLSAKSGNLSALQHLEITADSVIDPIFLRAFTPCPQLRSVNIPCNPFSWSNHNVDFSHITSLTLYCFIGQSIGHLLCRTPALQYLYVHDIMVSEDNSDDMWPSLHEMGYYTSSLSSLTVKSAQPEAWHFIRLPQLTYLELGRHCTSQNLFSMLCDSQCQLQSLHLDISAVAEMQQMELNFITLQSSLHHLSMCVDNANRFVQFLQQRVNGSCIISNLRSLSLQPCTYWDEAQCRSLALSICEMVESRCTVIQSVKGNIEISGLQAVTIQMLIRGSRNTTFWQNCPKLVHTRLSRYKEAGLALYGEMFDQKFVL